MAFPGVFLYDGDCAFCDTCAAVLRRHLRTRAQIVAWQATDLTGLGVTTADCATAVQWIGSPSQIDAGPAAFASLLRSTTGPRDLLWRLAGRVLGTRIVLAAAWPVYRFVARHRHRLPGATSSCALPRSTAGQQRSHR